MLSNDSILGMEDVSGWSTSSIGAVLGQSTTHSQGNYSISVKPSSTATWTPLKSVPLSTLAQVSPTLAVDVRLPTYQPNPYWLGQVLAYITCPSRGIWDQYLDQIGLTGLPLNVWNTLKFPLTNDLVSKLLQAGYSDLQITIVLNVPVPTTGIYLVDNVRFLPVPSNGCGGRPNGTLCTDNNACTLNDKCQAGACVPGTPLTCTPSDQCHNVGTCNSSTGVCSNPEKPNGTACNDGNACTQTDTCQSGTCTGANLKTCIPLDQCHTSACVPATGLCLDAAKPDGAACDDSNACTNPDQCQGGTCIGAPTLVPPSGLTATAGSGEVSLSWNPAAGATGYNVKRAITSGGPYTPLPSVSTTTYLDAERAIGPTYYYVVTSTAASCESAASIQVSATPYSSKTGTFPPGPGPCKQVTSEAQTSVLRSGIDLKPSASNVVAKAGSGPKQPRLTMAEKAAATLRHYPRVQFELKKVDEATVLAPTFAQWLDGIFVPKPVLSDRILVVARSAKKTRFVATIADPRARHPVYVQGMTVSGTPSPADKAILHVDLPEDFLSVDLLGETTFLFYAMADTVPATTRVSVDALSLLTSGATLLSTSSGTSLIPFIYPGSK